MRPLWRSTSPRDWEESLPVARAPEPVAVPSTPRDRDGNVYMNTKHHRGSASSSSTATAMPTEVGHLSGCCQRAVKTHPLTRQMDRLTCQDPGGSSGSRCSRRFAEPCPGETSSPVLQRRIPPLHRLDPRPSAHGRGHTILAWVLTARQGPLIMKCLASTPDSPPPRDQLDKPCSQLGL